MMRLLFWPFRYVIYLLSVAAYYFYRCLLFASKPAGLWLIPIAMLLLAGWQADNLVWLVAQPAIISALDNWIPIDPKEVELFAIITLAALVALFIMASRLLRPLLGSLPPMRRPISPQRLLKAKNYLPPPARARVASPKLKHRFKAEKQDELYKRLPSMVQAVMSSKKADESELKALLSIPAGVTSSKVAHKLKRKIDGETPQSSARTLKRQVADASVGTLKPAKETKVNKPKGGKRAKVAQSTNKELVPRLKAWNGQTKTAEKTGTNEANFNKGSISVTTPIEPES